MPLGLVNASASYSRLMRKLLEGMQCVDNFIDDVIITHLHSRNIHQWFENSCRDFVQQIWLLNGANFIGYRSLECLGHIVGDEKLRPLPEKVTAIQNFNRPSTKKQVRSLIGMVGFYRKFIPNFSAIAGPLTDLTRKGQPNKVVSGDPQENAFITLKSSLTVTPILKIPNLSETFVLQTDASDVGVGAVLLQYEDGVKKPVAYASKKLSKSQVNYSTIEKVCYAIVWAVQKFQRYLYGQEFYLETDP